MSENNLKLAVIVPCFNEENAIEGVVGEIKLALKDCLFLYEIIIVDDGSSDRSVERVGKLQIEDKNIKLIIHDQNYGFGSAFWSGVKTATAEFIIMIPGDGECNVKDAFTGIKIADEVDIVIPFVYNKINRTFFRRSISFVYTTIINLSFNTRLNYTNGTVIYRRTLIKEMQLISTGFFYQTEILMRLIKSGYLYAEIPVFLNKRSSGVSKALSPHSLLNVIINYIKIFAGVMLTRNLLTDIHPNSATARKIFKFSKFS